MYKVLTSVSYFQPTYEILRARVKFSRNKGVNMKFLLALLLITTNCFADYISEIVLEDESQIFAFFNAHPEAGATPLAAALASGSPVKVISVSFIKCIDTQKMTDIKYKLVMKEKIVEIPWRIPCSKIRGY